MKPSGRRLSALVASAAVCAIAWFYLARAGLLSASGELLVAADAPKRADVVLVLRGDETLFERAVTAADLFRAGYADRVYVSSALNDVAVLDLGRQGVRLSTPQENIAQVLIQRGVPCEKIALDHSPPGGGTVEEARRLAAFMSSHDMTVALAVTSWFHSRRTRLILGEVLGASRKSAALVVAQSSIGPHNWWAHRYVAITVLEEFVKLLLHYTVGRLQFTDDPRPRANDAGPVTSSACSRREP
jgi:uncharacterized SAM-binding protein YcdF (DUF218 family)